MAAFKDDVLGYKISKGYGMVVLSESMSPEIYSFTIQILR